MNDTSGGKWQHYRSSALSLILLLFASTGSRGGAAELPSLQVYSEIAMSRPGDPHRGRAWFTKELTGCAKCHSIDASGRLAGPDLFAIGDKFPRRELIRSILEPSSTIAVGYATTIIETRDDEEFEGVLKQASDTFTELILADGTTRRIHRSTISVQRTSDVSLMPEGLALGMTPGQFADLIAYLETLRQPTNSATSGGMPEPIPIAVKGVSFEPFFAPEIRFRNPSWFGAVPGRTNAYLVLEDAGRIAIVTAAASGHAQRLFADLSGSVRRGGGSGLLALAFHPRFASNRRYYLLYQIAEQARMSTLVVERLFSDDFASDAGVSREILRIPCATQDHTGGSIEFGPDGLFYIGMGDSGPQRDPQGHGQRMDVLLGKILRVDLDRIDGERLYSIPLSNPFLSVSNARPEIWALGLREPWRFSFDPITGDLWVGDVGQDQVEEVSMVRAGENHGWNVFEGFTPFSTRYRKESARYVPPVFAYPHRLGVSVTGGYVYRGKRAPAMEGYYIFGDFESRRIWALTQTNRVLRSIVEIGRAPTRIVSFTQDNDGELYLVGYDSGVIYRLGLAAVDPRPMQVRVIAQTAEQSGVDWSYTLTRPDDDWLVDKFDDSFWLKSAAGFGTRNTPGAVVRTDWSGRDIWLRRQFTLNELPGKDAGLMLRMHHDEDVEVYINGVEAARARRWTTGYTEFPINPEAIAALRAGSNVMAIHCRQNGGGQYIDAGIVEYTAPDANAK